MTYTNSEPGRFSFTESTVTLTVQGTEFASVAFTLPGGLPVTLVCGQSFALGRALREAISFSDHKEP